jgi:hypothetical protein
MPTTPTTYAKYFGATLILLTASQPAMKAQGPQILPTVSTIATASSAGLSATISAAIQDAYGNTFISDTGNNVIRRVDAKGNVTVYAGGAMAVCSAATDTYGNVVDGRPLSCSDLQLRRSVFGECQKPRGQRDHDCQRDKCEGTHHHINRHRWAPVRQAFSQINLCSIIRYVAPGTSIVSFHEPFGALCHKTVTATKRSFCYQEQNRRALSKLHPRRCGAGWWWIR